MRATEHVDKRVTGHTDILKEKRQITFQEFALHCAMYFNMRVSTDNFDVKINRIKKAAKKARKRFAAIQKWSNALAEQKATNAFKKQVAAFNDWEVEKKRIRSAYLVMLKQAKKWIPPKSHEVNLKSFMIFQLEVGLTSYSPAPDPPQRSSGEQYRARCVERARQEILACARDLGETESNREYARREVEWMRTLQQSLNRK